MREILESYISDDKSAEISRGKDKSASFSANIVRIRKNCLNVEVFFGVMGVGGFGHG